MPRPIRMSSPSTVSSIPPIRTSKSTKLPSRCSRRTVSMQYAFFSMDIAVSIQCREYDSGDGSRDAVNEHPDVRRSHPRVHTPSHVDSNHVAHAQVFHLKR